MARERDRRPMIVTFKPKDQRSDQTDKVEIVRRIVSSRVQIYDAAFFSPQRVDAPIGMADEDIGFDVNLYAAPIVALWLNDQEALLLQQNPNVAMVEDDGRCYALADDFVFERCAAPDVETVPMGVQQVKAPAAWDTARGQGVTVAILDTGVDGTHPDLAPNFAGGVSMVPNQTPADGNGHGTHCAGTIGAARSGSGLVGVAPEATLYSVKVLSNSGAGNWSWVLCGLNWCVQNKVQVASMSLGGNGAPVALETMCDVAFRAGILLVAAAGNAGPTMDSVLQPARYKSVMAVSSLNEASVIAPSSSRGPEVGVSAPGVQVLSTLPGGGFGVRSGTSMACPHVSGGAAVAWSAHPSATNLEVWDLLASTADDLGPAMRDPLYGFGRLNVENATLQMTPAPPPPTP
jgi:subtilisin